MNQTRTLALAFGGTLVLLVAAFFAFRALTDGDTVVLASPSASADASASLESSATAGPSATPRLTATPAPTGTPQATATAKPAGTQGPTLAPGTTFDVVVLGQKYASKQVPANGSVTNGANGSILMTTDTSISDELTVTYRLPASAMPAGTQIASVDVAVCGSGQGDFWETYGPPGGEPEEHEVTPPDADGCWHYFDGGSNTTVLAIIRLDSTLRIDRLVYTVTTR